MGRAFLVGSLILSVAACATDTGYTRNEGTAEAQVRPSARYQVPPDSPEGSVTVSSRGVVFVEPRPGGERTPMLHVALTAANRSDEGPWSLDAREQRLSVAGEERVTPALVHSSAGSAPVIQIPRGAERTVDLYYRLPDGVEPGAGFPGFDLRWQVRTPSGLVAVSTPFERVPAARRRTTYAVSPYSYGAPRYGWGPRWWYDPFYYPRHYYPPTIHFGAYYGAPFVPVVPYHARRPRYYVPPRSTVIAPPTPRYTAPVAPSPPSVPTQPNISAPLPSAPAPLPSAPAPSPPPVSAPPAAPPPPPPAPPPAPPVPSVPNISAPAPG